MELNELKKLKEIKISVDIEQNSISRWWTIRYKGKTYCVDFTYSDGQTLALLNRNYWQITDTETDEDVTTALEGEKPTLSEKEVDGIIDFCANNFLVSDFKKEVEEVMGDNDGH